MHRIELSIYFVVAGFCSPRLSEKAKIFQRKVHKRGKIMKIENGNIQFEYLSAVSSSSIGEDAPVTVKAATPFHASNAPGEAQEVNELEQFVQMGRNAVTSFNRLFA